MKISQIAEFVLHNGLLEASICVAGVTILVCWLYNTSFAAKALENSRVRRNCMAAYMPFIPLLIWFGITWIIVEAGNKLLPDLADWQEAAMINATYCISTLLAMIVLLILVRRTFARRLKGFGLDIAMLVRDIKIAPVNLLAVYPLVTGVYLLTLLVGKLIYGWDFEIAQHDQLTMVTSYPQISVRILIIVTTIFVVPVFEEMLFRGMIQTLIRSYISRPWVSIMFCSAIFASMHPNGFHWPALFILSLCMGYAYEKSGSLYRSIIIHSLFNAVSIIGTMIQ